MLIPMAVAVWFLCGILAIYLAFASARRNSEIFDPVHIWLAILGPVSLALACILFAEGSHEKRPTSFPGTRLIRDNTQQVLNDR